MLNFGSRPLPATASSPATTPAAAPSARPLPPSASPAASPPDSSGMRPLPPSSAAARGSDKKIAGHIEQMEDGSRVVHLCDAGMQRFTALLQQGMSAEGALKALGLNIDDASPATFSSSAAASADAPATAISPVPPPMAKGRAAGSRASPAATSTPVTMIQSPTPAASAGYVHRPSNLNTTLATATAGGTATGAPRCLLRISHLQARGLRGADRSGTSDPYLVIHVGAETWTSRVIEKTLNPQWTALEDQVVFGTAGFDLGLPKQLLPTNSSGYRLTTADFEAEDIVYIQLKDKNILGKDEDLGSACVFFGDLFPAKEKSLSQAEILSAKQSFFNLAAAGAVNGGGGQGSATGSVNGPTTIVALPESRGKMICLPVLYEGKPSGEVLFALEAVGFRPPQGGALLTIEGASEALSPAPAASPSSSSRAESEKGSVTGAGTGTGAAGSEDSGPFFGDGSLSSSPNPFNCLKIAIVGASGLKPRSGFGSSNGSCNPYVQLNVGSLTVRTTVKEKTLSPKWEQGQSSSWAFPVSERATPISIEVLHSGAFGTSHYQGRALAHLSDFDGQRGSVLTVTLPLADREGVVDPEDAAAVFEAAGNYEAAAEIRAQAGLDINGTPLAPADGNSAPGKSRRRGTVTLKLLWCYNPIFDPFSDEVSAVSAAMAAASGGGIGNARPQSMSVRRNNNIPNNPMPLNSDGNIPSALPASQVEATTAIVLGADGSVRSGAIGRKDQTWGEVDISGALAAAATALKERSDPAASAVAAAATAFSTSSSAVGVGGRNGSSQAGGGGGGGGMSPAQRALTRARSNQAAMAAAARARMEALSLIPVKDGDWRVQVHVIEARQLKAENRNGTSDPCVEVECSNGQKRHTGIHKGTTGCVFDEHLFFSLPAMKRADIEALTIKLSVFDANLFRNSLIGIFQFDALEVYYQQKPVPHAYFQRWVGLVDPTNPRDRGLQGYLQVSVIVLGPGDSMPIGLGTNLPALMDGSAESSPGDPKPADAAAGAGGASGDKTKDSAKAAEDPTDQKKDGGGLLGGLFRGKKSAALAMEAQAMMPAAATSILDDGSGKDGESDPLVRELDKESDAASLVLLPPSLSRSIKWLVVAMHAAEGLPCMDEAAFGGLFQPGIDCFAEIRFAGNPPARTQWVTVKGRGNLSVEWHRELWIPFLAPAFSSRIEIAVYDYDRLKENDRVGTVVLSMKDLADGNTLPLSWWPVYGAPQGINTGKAKNRMNRLPAVASTYRGRLLLSARVEDEAEDDEMQAREQVFWTPTVRPPRELMPPLAVYRLRALVIAGDELPTSLSSSIFSGTPRLGVMVSIGGKNIWTPTVTVTPYGQARFNSLIECDITLPVGAGGAGFGSPSPAPLPDTILYLYAGDPFPGGAYGSAATSSEALACKRIAFARLDTEQLIANGLHNAQPFWQPLREDLAINALSDDQSAGSILLQVGIAQLGEALVTDWSALLKELEMTRPWELRVHVFQGRNLPAADASGSLDPYLRVSIAGQTRMTSKKTQTQSPCYYETLSFEDLMLPPLRFAPQVHIELWDQDGGDSVFSSFVSDDFCSEMRHCLASSTTLISSSKNLPRELPNPMWYGLKRFETRASNQGDDAVNEGHGELLLLFQLISKETRGGIIPMIPSTIIPACKDQWLEIIALGCRSLAPYALLPISYPNVEFQVSDVRQAVCYSCSAANNQSNSTGNSTPPDKALVIADKKKQKEKNKHHSAAFGHMAAAMETTFSTVKSRFPSGKDANFCERLIVPIKVPVNPLFAPTVNLAVVDNRFGGLASVVVGTAAINLEQKITWSPSYVPARGIWRPAGCNPFNRAADGLYFSGCTMGTPCDARTSSAATGAGSSAVGLGGRRISNGSASRASMTWALRRGSNASGNGLTAAEARPSISGSTKIISADGSNPRGTTLAAAAAQASASYAAEHDLDNAPAAAAVPKPSGPQRRLLTDGGVQIPVTEADALVGGSAANDTADDDNDLVGLSRRGSRTSQQSGKDQGNGEAKGDATAVEVAPATSTSASTLRTAFASGYIQKLVDVSAPLTATATSVLAAAAGALTSSLGIPTNTGTNTSASTGVVVRRPSASAAPDINDHSSADADALAVGFFDKDAARKSKDVATLLNPAFRDALLLSGPCAKAPLNWTDGNILRQFGVDVRRGLLTFDAASGFGGEQALLTQDEEASAYLKNRKEYGVSLEAMLAFSPFESFAIGRGKASSVNGGINPGAGISNQAVGTFKGIVRLLENPDEPAPICLWSLHSPKTYVIRVYVLTGHGLTPKDSNGKSDPYIKVKLGDTVVSKRSDYIPETTEPEFYQCIEVKTTLPGPSTLTISILDADFISSDDLIGETKIDLEDRFFSGSWQSLGTENEVTAADVAASTDPALKRRFRTKPIERRELWSPSSTASQGSIRMFVDILTAEQAVEFPPLNIRPPPPREYQLRAIVWKARKMIAGDSIGNMNDLYFKAWVEGSDAQETDTHYRAKKGLGSFNWRMVFPLTLPRKFFYFTLQGWDRDTLKYNDCLGEAKLDLGPHIKRALKQPTKAIQIFRSDQEILKEKEAAKKRQAEKDAERLARETQKLEKGDEKRLAKLQSQLISSGIASPESAPRLAMAALKRHKAKAQRLAAAGQLSADDITNKKEQEALEAEATNILSGRGDTAEAVVEPSDGGSVAINVSPRTVSASERSALIPGAAARRVASSSSVKPASGAGADASGGSKDDSAASGAGAAGDDVCLESLDDKDLAAVTGLPPDEARRRMKNEKASTAATTLASPGSFYDLTNAALGTAYSGVVAAATGLQQWAGIQTQAQPQATQDPEAPSALATAEDPFPSSPSQGRVASSSVSTRLASAYTGVPAASLVGLRSAAEAGDARASVVALKKAAGLGVDVHPSHAQWISLYQVENSSGRQERRKTGEVLVTLELLPAAVAARYPAGLGRSAPNQFPQLPPPAGRMRCSANPCYMCAELCGARFFTSFLCCLCCAVVIAISLVGAPFINTIVVWLNLLPREAAVPLAVVIALLLFGPPIYGYFRYVACPRRRDDDEAALGDSAADLTGGAQEEGTFVDGVPSHESAGNAAAGSRGRKKAGLAAVQEGDEDDDEPRPSGEDSSLPVDGGAGGKEDWSANGILSRRGGGANKAEKQALLSPQW